MSSAWDGATANYDYTREWSEASDWSYNWANSSDAENAKCGVKLLVDPMSIQYLRGAEIDYQEGLEGAQFVIKNPNAKTTCGCGSSFST